MAVATLDAPRSGSLPDAAGAGGPVRVGVEGAGLEGAGGAGERLVGATDRLRGAAGEVDEVVRRVGAGALSSSRRREVLAGVDRVIAVLTATRAELLVAERESQAWRGGGDGSVEAWRGRTSRAGTRAATGQVRQAEVLTGMPRMRQAAVAGSISMEHVDALARVAASAPGPVREALGSVEVQDELLGIATRVDAGAFAKAAGRWAAGLDPAGHERGHQAQRRARFVHLTETDQGVRVKGLLDTMSGHRLRLALEAVDPRPGRDDDRTGEQRRADALVVLAEAVLTDPSTTSGAAVRPHVSMHLTEQTWATLRTHFHHTHTQPPGQSTGLGLGPLDPVTLDDGTPVPVSEVARVLCDCELTRVVIDADGAVLDAGRTQRIYTGVQRRAVIARDRACAWPGCAQHARWCEVHHLQWWDRDTGPTSVDNGVLLCSYHHHEVHRQDLTITREPATTGDASGDRSPSGSPPDDAPPGDSPPGGSPPGDSPPDDSPPGDSPPGGSPPDQHAHGRPPDHRDLGDPAHPYVRYVFRDQDGHTIAPNPRTTTTHTGAA